MKAELFGPAHKKEKGGEPESAPPISLPID
jgi:hypothetical protein